MLKKMITLFMFAMICFSFEGTNAHANSLVFICHKGTHYSKINVEYAFKGYLDEPRPVDNKLLFDDMLKQIGYTPAKYKKIWGKMFFRRALFIPFVKSSDEGVIDWVANNSTGIGYVSKAPNHPNVEVCGVE